MDIDGAATELYAMGLEDFTARRDELVAEARAAGDRGLAAEIKALRKPTVVAWLANQLARHNAAELGSLLELGESLRLATASLSGDELRQLSRQRTAVVQALGRQARALATSLDRPVSETVVRELEQTLLVALADPERAADLEAGRLTERLDHSGFSGPDSPTDSGRRRGPKTARKPVRAAGSGRPTAGRSAAQQAQEEERRGARRAALEAELEQAWRAASSAKDAHTAAQAVLVDARASETRAEQTVTTRRAELEAAESELTAATSAAQAASVAEREAEDAVGRARAAVRERQRDLDDLPR